MLLGAIGGAGLLIGPLGLLWLIYKRDPELADRKQTGMDVGFLALLFLTGEWRRIVPTSWSIIPEGKTFHVPTRFGILKLVN